MFVTSTVAGGIVGIDRRRRQGGNGRELIGIQGCYSFISTMATGKICKP